MGRLLRDLAAHRGTTGGSGKGSPESMTEKEKRNRASASKVASSKIALGIGEDDNESNNIFTMMSLWKMWQLSHVSLGI